MSTVQQVLSEKGSNVIEIEAHASVLQATRLMNEHKCGALVVVQEGHVVGMFTERDVLVRVVASERLPAEVLVAEVMTADVVCIRPEASVDEAGAVMRDRRIRHLPVCDEDGRLHGVISIGDVNACHAQGQQSQIHFLNEYIYGRV